MSPPGTRGNVRQAEKSVKTKELASNTSMVRRSNSHLTMAVWTILIYCPDWGASTPTCPSMIGCAVLHSRLFGSRWSFPSNRSDLWIRLTMITRVLTTHVFMVRPILNVKVMTPKCTKMCVPKLTAPHGLPLRAGRLPIASFFFFCLKHVGPYAKQSN